MAYEELDGYLMEHDIGIAFAQEHALPGDAQRTRPHYMGYYASANDDGQLGAAVSIRHDMVRSGRVRPCPLSPRLLYVRLDLGDIKFKLLSGRSFIQDAPAAQRSTFWQQA